jgi:hypothetical protein
LNQSAIAGGLVAFTAASPLAVTKLTVIPTIGVGGKLGYRLRDIGLFAFELEG